MIIFRLTVYLKGLEITDYDPTGLFRIGQRSAISLCLLIRPQVCTIGLDFSLTQIDLYTLLLNQCTGLTNIAINVLCSL